jgi:hypothetical protein
MSLIARIDQDGFSSPNAKLRPVLLSQLRRWVGGADRLGRRDFILAWPATDDLRSNIRIGKRVHALGAQPLIAFWTGMIDIGAHIRTAAKDGYEQSKSRECVFGHRMIPVAKNNGGL